MSRRLVMVLVVGLMALPIAGPLSGQETEVELQRRIDSLEVLVADAYGEAEAARVARARAEMRIAEAEYSLDTLLVAGMTIVTRDEDASAARDLFAEVWNESFQGFESRLLPDRTFTYLRAAYDLDPIPVDGPHEGVVLPVWLSREQAKARIRGAIGRVLSEDLDGSPLGAWLRGGPFTAPTPSEVYRRMVLARSIAVDRCLADDIAACTSALGLGPSGHSVSIWYSPDQRRARALEAASFDEDRGASPMSDPLGPALARCVDLVAPDACDVLLEGQGDSFSPLSFRVRATLADVALELGGDGAWNRLIEDPSATPEEALTHAAGVSLDELVAAWRARIVDNRPEVQAGLPGNAARAVLWILLFVALSTRSTRWRFA